MWDKWSCGLFKVIVWLMSMVACSFGFSGFIYCIGHVKIHKYKVLVCLLSWMCFSSSLIGHTGLIQIHENFLLCCMDWCWHECIRISFPLCFVVGLNQRRFLGRVHISLFWPILFYLLKYINIVAAGGNCDINRYICVCVTIIKIWLYI